MRTSTKRRDVISADDPQKPLELAAIGSRRGARTSDLVLAELTSAIHDLRLTPGQALSESALTEKLQVSRTPVREALARLAEAGLIQVLPQVGTRIGLIDPAEIKNAQFTREHLELGAYHRAAVIDDLDTTPLQKILEEQRAAFAAGNTQIFFATDEALHRTIFDLADLPGVWDVVARTKIQMDRLRRLTLPEPSTGLELIEEHATIVEGLVNRVDSTAVEAGAKVLRSHSRRALEHLPRLQSAYPNYFVGQRG